MNEDKTDLLKLLREVEEKERARKIAAGEIPLPPPPEGRLVYPKEFKGKFLDWINEK